MASTNDTLPLTTYFLSVYLGYFIVFIGVFGNLMNILVFTQLRLFRRNQSALYLTVASIADFAELIFPITTDITATAFNFDLTRTSALWCKFETYLAKSSRIISTMTICLAAVDQYLSTNYNSNLRRLSTYNSAQYLTRILFIFALAYSGLFLVFQNISPHLDCATFDSIFNYFYSFFHYCIFVGIFPIFISLLFSLLAYRNVRRIVRRQIPIIRRRLDHQLTAMILIRVAWFVITTLPYISFRIYQINNVNCYYSGCALADIELINSIFLRLYSLNYSGTFFIFLLSSRRFCRQVKYMLHQKIRCKCFSIRISRNQIVPHHTISIIRDTLQRTSIYTRNELHSTSIIREIDVIDQ